MNVLVGFTGFVGSNLFETCEYDMVFNSKNISDAYNLNPDILVYAGVRGTKFLANMYPETDRKNIDDAIYNIKKINPRKLVLISTVDVYDDLNEKDETYTSDEAKLCIYGRHRLYLEEWVKNNILDYSIIRIPALYGKNLKKNFLYDLNHPVPTYLKKEIFDEAVKEEPLIKDCYQLTNDGIFKLINKNANIDLDDYFSKSKYNSIHFTDSRSQYQFFNLKYLGKYIDYAISENIRILNIVTEPVTASELYSLFIGKEFKNEITSNPIKYNLTSKYFNRYVFNKQEVLHDLLNYLHGN